MMLYGDYTKRITVHNNLEKELQRLKEKLEKELAAKGYTRPVQKHEVSLIAADLLAKRGKSLNVFIAPRKTKKHRFL